jgi:hypothetical protein
VERKKNNGTRNDDEGKATYLLMRDVTSPHTAIASAHTQRARHVVVPLLAFEAKGSVKVGAGVITGSAATSRSTAIGPVVSTMATEHGGIANVGIAVMPFAHSTQVLAVY